MTTASTRDAELRRFGCTGKRMFETWSEAQHVARLARRKGRDASPLEPYRCRFCAGWHLHSLDAVERRRHQRGLTYDDGDEE